MPRTNKTLYEELLRKAAEEEIDRCTVGGVIVNNERILLLQRPQDDFLSGFYELPSGRVETGETLDTALRREVLEETGLTITSIEQYLGHFDYTSKGNKASRQFSFRLLVEETNGIRLSEHDSYAWVARNEIGNCRMKQELKDLLTKSDEIWN